MQFLFVLSSEIFLIQKPHLKLNSRYISDNLRGKPQLRNSTTWIYFFKYSYISTHANSGWSTRNLITS